MTIIHASAEHASALHSLDRHVAEDELRALIAQRRVLILEDDGQLCGWLRWNLFWDNTPFMNMLFVLIPNGARDWDVCWCCTGKRKCGSWGMNQS